MHLCPVIWSKDAAINQHRTASARIWRVQLSEIHAFILLPVPEHVVNSGRESRGRNRTHFSCEIRKIYRDVMGTQEAALVSLSQTQGLIKLSIIYNDLRRISWASARSLSQPCLEMLGLEPGIYCMQDRNSTTKQQPFPQIFKQMQMDPFLSHSRCQKDLKVCICLLTRRYRLSGGPLAYEQVRNRAHQTSMLSDHQNQKRTFYK